jgi:putative oxidoreductase
MNPNLTARALNLWEDLCGRLNAVGDYLPGFALRLVLGLEFFFAGLTKLRGDNWFSSVQDQFPFPFDVFPVGLSWTMATWFELIGGLMLLVGLGTRFIAFGLLVLTFVATAAVHWPAEWNSLSELFAGYVVIAKGQGNFQLPLLFAVMLLPLLFQGPGKLSLDYLLGLPLGADPAPRALADWGAWGLAALLLAIPFLLLIPAFGACLLVMGVALIGFQRWVVG